MATQSSLPEINSDDLFRNNPFFLDLPECRRRWLSDETKKQRNEALAKTHVKEPTKKLQNYFNSLKMGSGWDLSSLTNGAKAFAWLTGPGRTIYYEDDLLGMHFPETFTELWNLHNAQLPITVFEPAAKFVCPLDWSYTHTETTGRRLVFRGDGPLSQGLNNLVAGPTSLDCGIWLQVLAWMIIRGGLGDEKFDESFNFAKGKFVLTQSWTDPINEDRDHGSLLEPFLDEITATSKTGGGLEGAIQLRTVFSHPAYLAKHPGGSGRLQNVLQIHEDRLIFNPRGEGILSEEELQNQLLQSYNDPRDVADTELLFGYGNFPEKVFVHPVFEGRTGLALSREAEKFAHHTLSEQEWADGLFEREKRSHAYLYMFNLERVMSAIQVAISNSQVGNDVFTVARHMKKRAQAIKEWEERIEKLERQLKLTE